MSVNCLDSLLKISKENTIILCIFSKVFCCCMFITNFAWINAFSSRGVQAQPKIKTFDNVFITFYFTLVLNLFSVILRGVQLFLQGKWGSKLISIENFRNL